MVRSMRAGFPGFGAKRHLDSWRTLAQAGSIHFLVGKSVTGRKTKNNGTARPIRTQRDYKGAQSAAKKISGGLIAESAAEQRLQSLIHEMEKFDDEESEGVEGEPGAVDGGPRRRWSDETADPE
jgi:hypothetical protein